MGKDGVAGSIRRGLIERLTSGNAGQFDFLGCSDWPQNGSWPHPLNLSRLRYGPAMTADHTPSLLRSFDRHLRAGNRSDNTVESYLESIRQAETFLADSGRTLLDARRADLEAFLGDLLQRRAPATAATRYKVLRSQRMRTAGCLRVSPKRNVRRSADGTTITFGFWHGVRPGRPPSPRRPGRDQPHHLARPA
jgi:integrase family protein with SAM-like domain